MTHAFWKIAAIALCLALLTVLEPQPARAQASEDEKIDYLIATVEKLSGAKFIRNGSAYDAAAAADHLRLKRRNAGSRCKTAEDFIRWCASGSSMSGKPYRIRFADGTEVTSEAFLRARLKELDATRR
jgi:hypothetical protein